jgi:hypothetical protein
MSEAIKMPEAIHHSHQHQQQDLSETIFLFDGEGPGQGKTLGTVWNAEDFGFPEQTEEIEIAAKAFADKIVRAYNCHDDLVDALQELGDWLAYGLEKPDGAKPTAEDLRRCQQVAEKARAALDKAKGRSDAIS